MAIYEVTVQRFYWYVPCDLHAYEISADTEKEALIIAKQKADTEEIPIDKFEWDHEAKAELIDTEGLHHVPRCSYTADLFPEN